MRKSVRVFGASVIKPIMEKLRLVGLFCIKWRYLIALVALILGVVLQLHGSSINEYNEMFANSEQYNAGSIILGESRMIRSDEWLVNVPYNMSQAYNGYEKVSDMMSLSGQDMVIGGGAPVADATILAKPFMWGYVLFGNEYGLSWYWCAKMIVLILVSFEFCMILTRKNKKVSLIGTLLISFAPAMQWWSILDVYIWGMALLALGYYFFTTKGWLRNLCTGLLPFVAVAFVLILYPAFQWPTGLLMVALLIAVLIRDKKTITFKKIDILRIVGITIVVVGIVAYTILTSLDSIMAMANTAYPGAVIALGGNNVIKDLFTDLTNFTLPFEDITYSNNCEISTFVQLAPVFLMLYPIIRKRAKRDKNMIVGDVLVGCLGVMIVFMLAGFPELLAKVTLFSYVTRMKITYGFAATIFTIWGIDMVWRRKVLTRKNILIALAVMVGLYICFIGKDELSYLGWRQYAVIIVGFAVLAYVILSGRQKLAVVGIVLLMGICGMTVNPVVRGATALLGHPLEQKVAEIAESDEDANWLAVGNNKLASIAVANGAKTLNMVNVYPDSEKWEKIDSDGSDKDTYNRYAHIWVNLTEDETEIKLGPARDVVDVSLSCTDVSEWSVRYLITAGELSSCEDDYTEIYHDTEGEYYIYERSENEKRR